MMADNRSRAAVEAALERLLETLNTPRALVLHAQDRAVLEQAVVRARTQLLGPPEPVLTVVLAGGTGAGKSALINALLSGGLPSEAATSALRAFPPTSLESFLDGRKRFFNHLLDRVSPMLVSLKLTDGFDPPLAVAPTL